MENGSRLRVLGRLKAAIAADASARTWRSVRIKAVAAVAATVAILGCVLLDGSTVAVGAGFLAALGLLLATLGLSALRAARRNDQAAIKLVAGRDPVPAKDAFPCFAAQAAVPAR